MKANARESSASDAAEGNEEYSRGSTEQSTRTKVAFAANWDYTHGLIGIE